MDLKHLQYALNLREAETLSPLAAKSTAAGRRHPETRGESDYRQPFSVDADRIVSSLAFTRYIDKTQVFSLIHHDHLTHRVLHVQLVSRIGRTLGRFLGLNEDLVEAIALGHDIGHTPFGHDGERYLSRICQGYGIGHFEHNAQSLQFLDRVEKKGLGLNLCVQTLNGILAHDGDIFSGPLKPRHEIDFRILDADCRAFLENPELPLFPATMEGCVVRMADIVGYIGRDMEDAIRLGLIDRSDLPGRATAVLGYTNGTMVYNLVTDIIRESFRRAFISMSEEAAMALKTLKKFNLERIYLNPKIKIHLAHVEELFRMLFDQYMDDLKKGNEASLIFRDFLHGMDSVYLDSHHPAEVVRDFIAGMTDRYFLDQCPESLRPRPLHMRHV